MPRLLTCERLGPEPSTKIRRDAYEYQDKPVIAFLYGIANFVLLEHYGRDGDERMVRSEVWSKSSGSNKSTRNGMRCGKTRS